MRAHIVVFALWLLLRHRSDVAASSAATCAVADDETW